MTAKETTKRYLVLIVGLFFTALGVAFTKHADLGVSPISAIANVMSIRIEALSLGSWLIVCNAALLAGQIIILGKGFNKIQLMQLPLSFPFGWFTDLGMEMVKAIPVQSYLMQLTLVFVGIVLLAFGTMLSVSANVIMNSGEAFVKAIADRWKKKFGNVKVAFDVSCVSMAAVLSAIFFDFQIYGIREGTLLTALLTGHVVKVFMRVLKEPLDRILLSQGNTQTLDLEPQAVLLEGEE